MARKLARALLAALVLLGLAWLWLSRSAGAAVYERALAWGAGMAAYLDDGSGAPATRTMEVNGQAFHVATGRTRDGVADVLDFYERRYPAARVRLGNDVRGMIVALDRGPNDWLDSLRLGDRPAVPGALGVVRLVYAFRAPSGATRFVRLWTDPGFDPRRLIAKDGDAPGFEFAGIPRPPAGRRLLAARERGGPFRLQVFWTPLPAQQVARHYAAKMAGYGWRARDGGVVKPVSADVARYVRRGDECTLWYGAATDGTRVVVVARLPGA